MTASARRFDSTAPRHTRGMALRRRGSLIVLLFAWLLATGSHWDLVQTFAWGRMIANYSATMSVVAAVRLTFTPETMCGVCQTVSEAKQQRDSDSTLPADGKGKILLVFQPDEAFVAAISSGAFRAPGNFFARLRDRSPPPVPPPRGLV